MNKQKWLKSLVHMVATGCLLWAGFGVDPTEVSAQQQPAATVQGAADVRLDFTAQVYQKKTKEPVENLTKSDFRLYEDKREQVILSVASDTRPLSIVAIVTLGRGPVCEGRFRDATVPRTMTILAQAFTQALKPEDELAVIITDKDARFVHTFNVTRDRINDDFAEVGRISEASEYGHYGIGRAGISYLGVKENYVEAALLKAVDYLNQNKKAANRPVILFLRRLNNVSSFLLVEQVKTSLLQEGVIVGALGKVAGSLLESYYEELPDLTGGDNESCYIFAKAKEPTIPTATVSAMLERLRTRYRITYTSTNPKRNRQVRKLKLELAPQRQKVKDKPVIRAPQAIIAPGP